MRAEDTSRILRRSPFPLAPSKAPVTSTLSGGWHQTAPLYKAALMWSSRGPQEQQPREFSMGFDRPVVAYCRVSTLEQKRRGYGIDIQVRDIQAFAERQGLLVARFYRDEAESGIKEDRKALRRLLRDCRAGRVGSVILPSLDRLSRDVRIADMPSYNGRDRKDVLVRQIREAIAEENRKDIIERLWKGRQERVRRGGAAWWQRAVRLLSQGEAAGP